MMSNNKRVKMDIESFQKSNAGRLVKVGSGVGDASYGKVFVAEEILRILGDSDESP